MAALLLPGMIAYAPIQSAAATAPARQVATDTIIGAGVSGPYYLSRNGLEPYGETVTRDGDRLVAGIDYVFNPAAGSLVFDSRILTAEVVTVRYWYNPVSSHTMPTAAQNGNLDAALLGIGSTSLHLTGDYTEGGPDHTTLPAFSSVSMILAQPAGKTDAVGAQLIFHPNPASPILNPDDVAVNGQFSLRGLKFTGKTDFHGNSPGLPGLQMQDANWTVQGNLTSHLTLDAGVDQQHPASGSDTGDDHVNIGLAPAPGLSIGGGGNVHRDRNRVQHTSHQIDTTVKGGSAFELTSHFADKWDRSAGTEQTGSLAIAANPLNVLGVNIKLNRTASAANGMTADANGKPVLSTERSLALHSVLAFLDLTGKYNTLDPEGPARAIFSRQFDVGYKLSQATQFSGSYLYNSQKARSNDSLYNYKLALSRKVGDLFNLEIAGQVGADNSGLVGLQTGLKNNASAKLGMSAHW